MDSENTKNTERLDFIRTIVKNDLDSGKCSKVVTRFPPEPNGYLHIGHAKSICLNFGIAEEFAGQCNLRFDDTNPCKEEDEYVESIKKDVSWLGFDWNEGLYFASDYFEKMYELAVELIKQGKAYVCDLSSEQIREYRGTLTEPGKESPSRDRSVEENLELFQRMRSGEFGDGEKVLRAKIDMKSPNINMRDPVMYRILHASHHRTGDKWCIYPMYDWAHGLEDSIEGITHSICTLEFEHHRPLYDWFLDNLPVHRPHQYEFARLNLTYTVMSKRKLLRLVQEGYVDGWDDPRMPTISGMRRRGFSPAAIRNFCKVIGVNKFNSTVDYALLEHCLRQDLNANSPRVMAVFDPLKVVITNYPENGSEEFDVAVNPEDESAGMRKVPFSKEIYVEKKDFMIDPPRKFFRLAPGREVRLRGAYFIKCHDYKLDENGEVAEVHCTYDPESRGGSSPDGRKVRGTLHWVSAEHALRVKVNIYEHLFNTENPEQTEQGQDFTANINENSLQTIDSCLIEPSVKNAKPLDRYQFERIGYFCVDKYSGPENIVFNRTVTLKDTWAKMQKKKQQEKK
ncbi:Glutamine--tRNA ligase [Sedimentisphaera cyanobacteriorum]|uniref:Glutamine--tRNA ligase n=1 Tax=Sedimentisphaera cyanobacteriorum TaxID=1940790 RepID=A0A1Q2HQD0_9BACT|nr:glutamine--tRNA ligase/YqeY domain fusion protein [Sedimentisphaera cyanobacteriorum]AQQ09648.1 Glutamine--tRNA ligase [Sedimentisphaera cyanobacteriorum]